MTLTFKTAKHAIDKYGDVSRIVEHSSYLTGHSLTRERAKEINEYDPRFKPCIVVTTAREALEAAWELAHEPEDGVIPADTRYIRRDRSDGELLLGLLGPAVDADGICAERRLLDPPAPEPEPWELSRFCYADGNIYERIQGSNVTYWVRPGGEGVYRRIYLKPRNPRPVTIEGETE